MWDNAQTAAAKDVGHRASLAWIWYDVHSFPPYCQEVRDGLDDEDFKESTALSSSWSSTRTRASSDHANLQQVLTSLAPRYAEALKLLLASLQLEATSNGQEAVDCKYSTLQLYLTELRDHGIVEKIVDQHAGTEPVVVPCSKEMLHVIIWFEIQKDAI